MRFLAACQKFLAAAQKCLAASWQPAKNFWQPANNFSRWAAQNLPPECPPGGPYRDGLNSHQRFLVVGPGADRLVRRTALSGGRDPCAAALVKPVRSRGVERNRGVPDPGNVLSGDVSCKPMRSFCQPIPQPLWPISVNWGQ